MTTLAVVSAGLGEPSSSHLLADRLAASVGARTPVTVRSAHLRDVARDIADNLVTGFSSPRLAAVVDDVVGADALIAVTPTFNASYSGLFKSFFDVLDPESLVGKPVLIGATGGTERHSLVLDFALRPLFAYLRADVVPTAVYAASGDWGSPQGLSDRIDRAAAELVGALAVRVPADGSVDRAPAGRAPADVLRAPAGPADGFADLVPFERLLNRS